MAGYHVCIKKYVLLLTVSADNLTAVIFYLSLYYTH